MDTPFPFEAVLVFGIMGVMLLIGMFIRASVKFFQGFLIPSCFIGGILGLVLLSLGIINVSTELLETFAYHLFVISFISLGLTTNIIKNKDLTVKTPLRGALWIGLVSGVVMAMQGIIGGLFVFLFNSAGYNLNPIFGFLSPLGFTQGPGQALSVGKVWEEFGFEHAATLGLSFAVLGFAFAFFIGVPLVNWGIRKGFSTQAPKNLSTEFLKGIMQKESKKEIAGELTTHSGNIDTLAFHAALVGLVYILTYLLMLAIGKFISEDVAKSLWAFFFFFGIVIALLLKFFINKAGLGHLLDPGIQRRITGWSVDFLIISTIMAIQVVIVWEYIVPIFVIGLATGVLTTIVVIYLGRRTWSYSFERTMGVYGITTGTASVGLLLLRIADPEFETPVGLELGIQAIFASPFVLGYMLLMHAPLWWNWSVESVVFIYAGAMLFSLILLKLFKFIGPRKF
jgi:glutamate:Na+ symporter, ESS family